MITVLQSTGSTNEDARDREKYHHGDAVRAIEQTAGRGQRGNKWESHAGENLTFSLVWEPDFLPVAKQFLLSECVALAVVDMLAEYGIAAMIKWTNDIYVGDNKICGILIEHELKGSYMKRTIAGIGVNVNQQSFGEWVPNPTSMSLETKSTHNISECMDILYAKLMARYEILRSGGEAKIEADYRAKIYRLGAPHTFATPTGEHFTGTIRGVEHSGALQVEIAGELQRFLFKEIEFVIAQRGR